MTMFRSSMRCTLGALAVAAIAVACASRPAASPARADLCGEGEALEHDCHAEARDDAGRCPETTTRARGPLWSGGASGEAATLDRPYAESLAKVDVERGEQPRDRCCYAWCHKLRVAAAPSEPTKPCTGYAGELPWFERVLCFEAPSRTSEPSAGSHTSCPAAIDPTPLAMASGLRDKPVPFDENKTVELEAACVEHARRHHRPHERCVPSCCYSMCAIGGGGA
jgi:hypothetical protein